MDGWNGAATRRPSLISSDTHTHAHTQGARFEGTAMDGKVKVVMNGRMEPQGVTVQDGALGDAKVLFA